MTLGPVSFREIVSMKRSMVIPAAISGFLLVAVCDESRHRTGVHSVARRSDTQTSQTLESRWRLLTSLKERQMKRVLSIAAHIWQVIVLLDKASGNLADLPFLWEGVKGLVGCLTTFRSGAPWERLY
jgi:hypothetical protein